MAKRNQPYNGHESWQAWNVSLWIANDYGLYSLALRCLEQHANCRDAAQLFRLSCGSDKTPDGARYSQRAVYLALRGLKDD